MSLDFSSINPRYDIESIAKSLGEASPSGGGYSCLCPAHDDHSPSLSISLGNDGKLLLKCFAGCSFEDIIQTLKHKNLLDLLRKSIGGCSNPQKDLPKTTQKLLTQQVYYQIRPITPYQRIEPQALRPPIKTPKIPRSTTSPNHPN